MQGLIEAVKRILGAAYCYLGKCVTWPSGVCYSDVRASSARGQFVCTLGRVLANEKKLTCLYTVPGTWSAREAQA